MAMDEKTREAYERTAEHFNIDVSDVRRHHIRAARAAGAHDVPERWMAKGGRGIRGPVERPLEAVPEGYEVRSIKTGPRGQTVTSGIASDPATIPDVPDYLYVDKMTQQVRADGAEVQRWNKYKPENLDRAQIFSRLVRDFDGKIPIAKPLPSPANLRDDLLTVYPIGDPHIGLRGHDGTGLQEGIQMLHDGMQDLVHRGTPTREAMILNLGDFYHSDDPSNRTRRSGYALDVDGAWYDILRAGADLFIGMIRVALVQHERVHVKCLIGNHDDLSSLFLTLLTDQHFRDEPRVTVDTSGDMFQWYEFGKCFFGMTHGQKMPPARLFEKMTQQHEAWGRTLHRYWLCGHVHHTRKIEHGGVLIESFRTLAPRDAHHEAAGYISGRDLNRIVYHREGGEVSRETVSAHMLGLR